MNGVVSVDSILDIPCAFCPLQDECIIGGPLSPTTCNEIVEWLDTESLK